MDPYRAEGGTEEESLVVTWLVDAALEWPGEERKKGIQDPLRINKPLTLKVQGRPTARMYLDKFPEFGFNVDHIMSSKLLIISKDW